MEDELIVSPPSQLTDRSHGTEYLAEYYMEIILRNLIRESIAVTRGQKICIEEMTFVLINFI